jgi:hypothetical protein
MPAPDNTARPDRADGAAPARSPQTERDYERRFLQLKRAARTEGNRTVPQFCEWLIKVRCPTLSASSWRQVRCAARWGLSRQRVKQPHLADQIDAAIDALQAARASRPGLPLPLRTSRQKAKRWDDDDLAKIRHRALSGTSPNREALADFLEAGNLTGLRPIEWPTAKFGRSAVPGFDWELVVKNAKQDAVRAHGDTRSLRWASLDDASVAAIENTIRRAREAQQAGTYSSWQTSLRDLMYRLTLRLFPRRKHRPTPYTGRHAAAARWKAHYAPSAASLEQRIEGLAHVAALLGHATDATATSHYARPTADERGSAGFPVPVADPAEVARIRKRLARNLERLARCRPHVEEYRP